MPRNDIDVESPRPLELSFAPFIKEDEPSVATHLSESDSEFVASTQSHARYVRPLRKLALVAVLATILGIAAGFGARHREESSSSQSMTNPVSSETPSMESVTGEEGHRASASVTTQYIFTQQTSQTTSPVYSLTASQPSDGYNPRVEGSSISGTVSGVVTSLTATPTEDPNQSTTPPFSGVVSLPATSVGWPELLGMRGDQAKQIIEDEGKGYTVIIVPPGGVTTKDWNENRVFIYVNDQGYVIAVPYPGR